MNLSHLYYFRKLAELEHYTKAAKELFITQPTLSNSIAQLERELEIPLFQRDGRRVKLTRYGREFYEYTVQALNALEKGIALAKEHAGSPSGSIDIGTIYTIQGDYLPALLRAFRNESGGAALVNVYQGLSKPLIEDLENDRYEVVFTAFVPDKPHITFTPVTSQKLVAIMHRSHPLAWRNALTFANLRDVDPIVTYPPDTPIGAEVKALLEAHEITATGALYNDEITLASMVESTPGAVGIALETLGLAPFKELIVKRLSEVDDNFHPVYMAYKTGGYKTRAVENFIEFTKNFKWEQR